MAGTPIPTPEQMATWPAPNYVNPETRAAMLIGIQSSFTTFAVIVVIARLLCPTLTKNRTLGLDDACMAVATVILVAVTIINCMSTNHGVGYHVWDFKPEWLRSTGIMSLIEQVAFAPVAGFTKIAILLFYKRIFTGRRMRMLIDYGNIVIIAFSIAFFFALLFQCIPIESYWNVTLPGARCVNQVALCLVAVILNTVGDIYVFILPLFPVWRLKLSKGQRLGLMFVFALGLVVCVVAIVRVWYTVVFFSEYDATYNGAVMSSLLVMEISLGIVGGSLPTIKPLFVQCFPQLLRSNITSHPRNTGDMYALENGYQRGTFRAKTQGTKTHDTFNDSEEAIVLEDIKVGDLMLDADQQSGEGGKSDHWGGIQKTTCVKVDYGSREKGLSMV